MTKSSAIVSTKGEETTLGLVLNDHCRNRTAAIARSHGARALGNVLPGASVGLFMGRYLSGALNGYRLFRRDVFADFRYTSRNFEIETEIIANKSRKGYRVVEVVSRERVRAGGGMKSSAMRHGSRFLARTIWEGFRGVKPRTAPAVEGVPAGSPESAGGA
jgi:hypothetical protein